MSALKSLLLQLLFSFLLEQSTYKFVFGVPIASEANVNTQTPLLTSSEDCSSNPCACCSDKLLVMAEEYSKSGGGENSDCASFLKNLFCTLACNEDSSEIGTLSNEIMVLSVCELGCSEILAKCPTQMSKNSQEKNKEKEESRPEEKKKESRPEEKKEESRPEEKKEESRPEEKKEESRPEEKKKESEEDVASTSNHRIAISNHLSGLKDTEKVTIGSFGVSDSLNLKNEKSKCSAISVPSMHTTKSSKYSLAFIPANSDTKVCLNSSGGFKSITKIAQILKSELSHSGAATGSHYPNTLAAAPSAASGASGSAPLTQEEIKCGFCFSKCCCWPVWSGSIISFAAYLVMAFLAIYWQSALFSLGLKSSHFWKGGGYWLAGSGGLGVFVGMLVGGLVSSCFAGALSLGGSLTNLFMSVLLVGRLGAALGGVGGLGTGASIGLMAHSGTVSWTVGLVLGLLLGLVVGFSPIARSLKMNDRYIRRGIRQRELRRRSRLSDGSYHSEGFSDASGTDRGKRSSVQRNISSDSRGDHTAHINDGNSNSSSSAANSVN